MSAAESFLTSLKNWFSSESAEAKKVKEDLEDRLDSDLTRRESELAATPEQRLDSIQTEIDNSDSMFDEIRAKIDTSTVAAELDATEADAIDDVSDDLST